MSFDIRFIRRSFEMEGLVVHDPRPAAKGRISIGSFYEDFYSPLDVWQCDRYEEQWQDAVRRLRRGQNSCFVVATHPVEIAQFIECWIVWRLATEYRVQNQYLFFDRVGIVDPADPYDALWPYTNMTDDGERIYDDWSLPLNTFDVAGSEYERGDL